MRCSTIMGFSPLSNAGRRLWRLDFAPQAWRAGDAAGRPAPAAVRPDIAGELLILEGRGGCYFVTKAFSTT
jgi:hypothetical protein